MELQTYYEAKKILEEIEVSIIQDYYLVRLSKEVKQKIKEIVIKNLEEELAALDLKFKKL
jgi:hypothetical protein